MKSILEFINTGKLITQKKLPVYKVKCRNGRVRHFAIVEKYDDFVSLSKYFNISDISVVDKIVHRQLPLYNIGFCPTEKSFDWQAICRKDNVTPYSDFIKHFEETGEYIGFEDFTVEYWQKHKWK